MTDTEYCLECLRSAAGRLRDADYSAVLDWVRICEYWTFKLADARQHELEDEASNDYPMLDLTDLE